MVQGIITPHNERSHTLFNPLVRSLDLSVGEFATRDFLIGRCVRFIAVGFVGGELSVGPVGVDRAGGEPDGADWAGGAVHLELVVHEPVVHGLVVEERVVQGLVAHERGVHPLIVHERVVHTLAVHERIVHTLVVHGLVVHGLAVHERVVYTLVVHKRVVHTLVVHGLVVHGLVVHGLVVHGLVVHELVVHELAVIDWWLLNGLLLNWAVLNGLSLTGAVLTELSLTWAVLNGPLLNWAVNEGGLHGVAPVVHEGGLHGHALVVVALVDDEWGPHGVELAGVITGVVKDARTERSIDASTSIITAAATADHTLSAAKTGREVRATGAANIYRPARSLNSRRSVTDTAVHKNLEKFVIVAQAASAANVSKPTETVIVAKPTIIVFSFIALRKISIHPTD